MIAARLMDLDHTLLVNRQPIAAAVLPVQDALTSRTPLTALGYRLDISRPL